MLAEILIKNRSISPLVHCITNYVTANDCANLLLACGGSAIMADDPEEVEEITSLCSGVVLNLGTPNPRKLEALMKAGQKAAQLRHGIVFDPVGAGGSQLRQKAAQQLLSTVPCSVIRGNSSEIRTLVQGCGAHRGVDADTDSAVEDRLALAKTLAKHSGAVVALTGTEDIVTDGDTAYRVQNGHPMMGSVTGSGCMLSALLGAYVSSNPEQPLTAALAAVCAMGLCGEIAHQRLTPLDGNATYRNYIIDAIYNMTPEELEKGANYELC